MSQYVAAILPEVLALTKLFSSAIAFKLPVLPDTCSSIDCGKNERLEKEKYRKKSGGRTTELSLCFKGHMREAQNKMIDKKKEGHLIF